MHALQFGHEFPEPLKGSKKWNPPNMSPLLHWGNEGIIRGFHFLDPLGGLGLWASWMGVYSVGGWVFGARGARPVSFCIGARC